VRHISASVCVSPMNDAQRTTLDGRGRIHPDSLLRLKMVLQIVPVAASTWWAGVRDGRFPKAVKLGPRTTCWRARDVLALIERPGGGQ
jgi:prophage regulatory protein